MDSFKKRSISDDFFLDLKEGQLKALLEIVLNDNTLCLEFRGNNIVIYYRGGALYTVGKVEEHKYEIWFNGNYDSDRSLDDETNKYNLTISEAVENVGKYKYIMDKYFSRHRKYEREFQQLILRENNYTGEVTDASDYYILDIEYTLNSGDLSARYDMLAIKWPSESGERRSRKNLPLTFIEVKYGDKSIDNDSGIEKHIDDYISLRKKPTIIKAIAEDMSKVFYQKHSLGLITSYSDKQEKLEISIDSSNVEYLLIFANHDPDKTGIMTSLSNSIRKYREKDLNLLNEIKVAKSSEMGYGLFAYKNKEFCYPTICEYVNQI